MVSDLTLRLIPFSFANNAMSVARIQADLQRIDSVLRGGCSACSSLAKPDASSQAWDACVESLAAVDVVLQASVFAESGAAAWIRWRKSSTSKQLLRLLKLATEFVAAEAGGRGAAAAGAVGHADPTRKARMASGLYVCILVAHHLMNMVYIEHEHGALWPDLRSWLAEPHGGGLELFWEALAWTLSRGLSAGKQRHLSPSAGSTEDHAAHMVGLHAAHTALLVTLDETDWLFPVSPACLQRPHHITAALALAVGELVPRAFVALMEQGAREGSAANRDWDAALTFVHRVHNLCICGTGEILSEPLQLPVLRAWPYMVSAARQRRSLPPPPAADLYTVWQGQLVGGAVWGICQCVWHPR